MTEESDDEAAWGNSGVDGDERAPDADESGAAPWETAGRDAETGTDGDEGVNGDDDDDDPSIAAVFGAESDDLPPRPEIVPETPNPENVAFLLLGVLFGLFVIWRAVVVFVP